MAPTTPLRFYDPHARKRSQIEHKILLLAQEIQNLQVQRNSFLPISSMPNEVLSHIFLLCRGRDYDSSCTTVSMRNLLRLTWVCHDWRTIALSTASLWAQIGKANLHWAEECLARSKQAPLKASLDLKNPSTFGIGTLALSQIHRFRHLQVYFPYKSSDWPERPDGFLTQPAPVLESLTLSHIPIPTSIFSSVFPLLHTVKLSACNITLWTSNTLPLGHLKCLSFDLCHEIPIRTFIQSLPPSLPNLETLRLFYSLVPSPEITPHLRSRIHLPNLKELCLGGQDMTPITEFFESCSLVPSTRVNTEVNATGVHSASGFRQLLQASQSFEHYPLISLQLYQEVGYKSAFYVTAFRNPNDDTPASFRLDHHISWPEIALIVTSLPVHNITTLTLTISELSVADWTGVFVPFVRLGTLILEDGPASRSFIKFIIASKPDHPDDMRYINLDDCHNIPFRSLHTLTLSEDYFEPDTDEVDADMYSFCGALRLRHYYGTSLRELHIPANAPTDYVDSFRDVVRRVTIYETGH